MDVTEHLSLKRHGARGLACVVAAFVGVEAPSLSAFSGCPVIDPHSMS